MEAGDSSDTGATPGSPDPEVLRLALRVWAFQCVRDDEGEFAARKDVEEPPEEIAAIERSLLTVNPLSRIDWDPPETDDEVDFRYVPGPELMRELLAAVRAQGPCGEHFTRSSGACTTRGCALPRRPH
ncbi:hypothetical protein [Streptomyces botrytidirepellens]|uniref:hypothetical protein n=1 Tax=Streptomyces botrytidirepellens TaxID=2486417 RepID=UPI0011CEBA44|nr:hypothetical protein [Streptomyces botrytidirepellens]